MRFYCLFLPIVAIIAMAREGRSSPNFQTMVQGEAVQRGWACLVQGRAELLEARSLGVREAG